MALAAKAFSAVVHVGGVRPPLEDEAALAQHFSHHGDVRSVSLRVRSDGPKVSWALVTFAHPAGAQRATDAAADELAEFGLVVRSVDTRQAMSSTGQMRSIVRRREQIATCSWRKIRKAGWVQVARVEPTCSRLNLNAAVQQRG